MVYFTLIMFFFGLYIFLLIIYLKNIGITFKLEYIRGVISNSEREEWKKKETKKSKIIYIFIVFSRVIMAILLILYFIS